MPRRPSGEEVEEPDSEMPSGAELPPDVLMELEREQLVRDAIAQLPPRCREMIEMLFFQQPPMAYNEVAQKLQLAIGSIGFIRGRQLFEKAEAGSGSEGILMAGNLSELMEQLAQEPQKRRRRELLMEAREWWAARPRSRRLYDEMVAAGEGNGSCGQAEAAGAGGIVVLSKRIDDESLAGHRALRAVGHIYFLQGQPSAGLRALPESAGNFTSGWEWIWKPGALSTGRSRR